MDPMTLSALIGAGGSLLGGLLGGGDEYSGPSAEQYLQQLYGMGKETFNPYMERGLKSQDIAGDHYRNMAQDPTSFVNEIMKSYKPSAGYDFRKQNALEAARNSAAAGGLSGTNYDQGQQAELVNGLLGQDMQEWLQNILGVHGAGLTGLEGESNRGYDAATNLASLLGNTMGAQSGLAYNREQQFNNQRNQNQMMGAGVGGLLGKGLGNYLGNKFGQTNQSQYPGPVLPQTTGMLNSWRK